MKDLLRILMVEDSEDDALLVLHQIKRIGYEIIHERVESAEEMKAALKKKNWNIILSDYKMPHFNGLEALAIFKETGIDIPFIIISGMIGEDLAVEAMRLGASDYLMKDNLKRLVPAIERELRETAVRAARRQDEEKLTLMNFALNHVREAVLLIDEGSNFHYVNEEACRVLGYSRTELLGMTLPDIDRGFSPERWPGHWQALKAKQSIVFESRHRAKDGRIFPVEINANYFEYDGRGYYLGLARDVTDRKHAEEALHRLNRELKAVSECNQILLRAMDEQTLLNDICRIICNTAGYPMAWVGYVERDEAKSVRPVAWAGTEMDHVTKLDLTWSGNSDLFSHPSGMAIQTGNSVCIQDIATDPRSVPWREKAIRNGYRAQIVMPLKDERLHVFGVLNIFSSEEDAFSPDETQLLKTLANDLAFGIQVIRGRIEHRTSNRKLRESEQRWRLTLEAVRIGVWDWDVTNDKWYASPTYYTMLGYEVKSGPTDRDEWVARLHPEDREAVVGKIQAVLSGNFAPYRYEARIRHADGTYRWQLVLGSAIEHGPDGKVSRILGIRMDIDERKQAEVALLEAERKYRTLVDNIPDCIVRFDPHARHLFVNSTVVKTFQAPADFFLGKTLKDTSGPGNEAHNALLNAMIREAFATGVTNTVESQWMLGDGVHDFEILHAPEKDEKGKVVSVLGIARDITSRKEAEDRLRESEAKYRRIVDTATEGIVILDEQFIITFTNARMAEMIGYKVEGLVGQPLTKFVFEEDLPHLQKRMEKRRRGISERYNLRHRHRNGQAVWIHVSAVPIQDSEGNFKGCFAMLTDITELKRVEQSQKEQIHFLECMERVNRAIQDNQDFERLMDALLDVVLDVFSADRAFLTFPCDPESEYWRISMERNRLEYSGNMDKGAIAMSPDVADFQRQLLAADEPVAFTPDAPLSTELYKRWQVRSILSMAIYPKVGKPWLFGIHQCSHGRVWTDQEIRLFKEIGQRFEGALTGVLMYRDLKESEEKLRDAEQRWRLTLEAVRIGVWDWDVTSDKWYASPTYYTMLGYEAKSGPSDRNEWVERLHPEDRAVVVGKIQAVLSGDPEPYRYEARMRHADGTYRWQLVLGSAIENDQDGKVARILGIRMDVHERKQAEEKMLRSDQRLRLHSEKSPLGFLEWDENFHAIEWNAACERIFGYTREEAIGRHAKDLILPREVHELVDGIFHSLMNQTGGQHSINENITKDGRIITCEWFNTTLINNDGKAIGVASVCRDISEQKRLERELFQAKKLEIIGRLAGGVAHEVRNPLNAILAISEALFKEKEIAENIEYLPYITHIRTQVTRLSKLMTDLLELGKPIQPTNNRLVPVDEVCAEAIQLWNQTDAAREHFLVFVSDVEPGSALVYTDRAKLQQVLFNLLDNAGQCSPQESEIRVAIAEAGDGKVSVTIKDHGTGIAPENIEWVFEPFFSLRKGGTGLGLALVKQFIEHIGGTVEIRNNVPPPGCTIELILNLSENQSYETENSSHRG